MAGLAVEIMPLERAREVSVPIQLLERLGYSVEALRPPERDEATGYRFQFRATKDVPSGVGSARIEVRLNPPYRSDTVAAAFSVVEGLFTAANHDFSLREFAGNLTLAEICATQGVAPGRAKRESNPEIAERIDGALAELTLAT